jgi:hypothetical protein
MAMSVKITDSVTLFERDDWDARRWNDYVDQGWSADEVFIHHTADSASGLNSLNEQKARMRAYQDFHMDTRGWDDIAYHIVVFPDFKTSNGTVIPARLFQGRPRDHVPAAQENHNRGTLAIAVVNADNSRMTRNSRYAIEAYLNWLLKRGVKLKTLGGHRDVVDTSCPGDGIYFKDLPVIRDATNLRKF